MTEQPCVFCARGLLRCRSSRVFNHTCGKLVEHPLCGLRRFIIAPAPLVCTFTDLCHQAIHGYFLLWPV